MRRMNSATLKLVLLIACCHALVHVFEHSFAGVEQYVAADPVFEIPADEATQETGKLGFWLRLPFGAFAFLAGWLADRYGSRLMLFTFLLGSAAAAVAVFSANSLWMMYVGLFTMGVFMSIYHPAGVGLISLSTTLHNRTMALGYHGMIGATGTALAPLLVAWAIDWGASWRQYYLILAGIAILLLWIIMWRLPKMMTASQAANDADELALQNELAEINGNDSDDSDETEIHPEDHTHWGSYALLISTIAMAGIVYAAICNFLPRFLNGIESITSIETACYLASGVLFLGILGQLIGGFLARPHTLERWMIISMVASAVCVFWMGVADGWWRLVAAGLFSPIFFMHQPVFNSLIAKYTPRDRRRFCYGLSFTCGFGVGSFGSYLAGKTLAIGQAATYLPLGGILCTCGVLMIILWAINRKENIASQDRAV